MSTARYPASTITRGPI